MKRLHVLVSGRVQGVGYRYFTEERARRAGITGWVKNLPDGRVEAEIQGDEQQLLDFLAVLHKGPRTGRVSGISKYEVTVDERDKGFQIIY